jgi:hypothetical protein
MPRGNDVPAKVITHKSNAIERAMADPQAAERPLQIATSWSDTFRSYNLRKFLRVMFWPLVALPHVILVAGGLGLWIN